jgi:molybdopterin-guanine dinucleotide biosynthesis protein A
MADPFDAVILAGGESRRLGGVDKAMIRVGGRSMLDRVLVACRDADRQIVVGPRRAEVAAIWCREEPPGGGPVAALAAGLAEVSAPLLVLLACDLPHATRDTVHNLLAAVSQDGAILVDGAGRDQPLIGAYRVGSLVRAVSALGPPYGGISLRTLVARLDLVRVPDLTGASRDCDTWEDVEVARHGG